MPKKALIVLIALFILLSAGAGFWQWKNWQKVEKEKQITLEKQKKAEETKRQEAQKENIDTSDWKIYRDEKLGFEFKYPEEVFISSKDKSVNLHKDCSDFKKEDFLAQMKCDLESNMSFDVTAKTINQIIESYKGDCQQDGHCFIFIASQEDYVLDGISGKKLIGTNAEGVGALNYIYATNKEKNYIISFVHLDSIYLSILSTFKFIK